MFILRLKQPLMPPLDRNNNHEQRREALTTSKIWKKTIAKNGVKER